VSAAAGQDVGTVIVTNMNDNTATVIDVGSRSVRATVKTGVGPHEVAASSNGRWAVVSNYGSRSEPGNSLTVIDLANAAVARTIDLGTYQRPHGIAFCPGDTTLVVTSEASQAVLLVDFRGQNVLATIPTSRPVSHMLALAKAGDRLFTTNIADGSITAIDLAGRATGAVIPVAKQVEGIAITPDGKQVWVGSNGEKLVAIVDVAQGKVIESIGGFGMPYRLAFTPDNRYAIISDPVKGQVRIFTVANHKGHKTVSIPARNLVATAEIPGSSSPEGVAASRDPRFGYVTLQGRNQMAAIDLEHGVLLWTLPVGAWPDGIAYAPPIE
jgi:YVTN family beta-propeller protein